MLITREINLAHYETDTIPGQSIAFVKLVVSSITLRPPPHPGPPLIKKKNNSINHRSIIIERTYGIFSGCSEHLRKTSFEFQIGGNPMI